MNDSHFMFHAANLGESQYLAMAAFGQYNEDVFGTYGPGETQCCISCTQTFREKRCFEVWGSQMCSDSYYSYNLQNCSDCIFCFNLKNKKFCVGNRELTPEKYAQVKKRLQADLAAQLKRDKKLPSLLDVVAKSRKVLPIGLENAPDLEQYLAADKAPLEKEFSRITKLLLDRELHGLDSYRAWLLRHTHPIEEQRSAVSGKRVLTLPAMIAIPLIPADRMLTMGEAELLGANAKVSPADSEAITLHNAHEKIGALAFFNVEFRVGQNIGMINCSSVYNSAFGYWATGMVGSKYSAFTFWPRQSNYTFGCDSIRDSQFVVNGYHSNKLTRCFEVDTCRDCTDLYYGHNCENVHDSMFCFNVKNLRHAIGNAELPAEEYKKTKANLLAQMADEFERTHDLKIDIYNVGIKRK